MRRGRPKSQLSEADAAMALGRLDAEGGEPPSGRRRFARTRYGEALFGLYISAYWRTFEVIAKRQMGVGA